MQPLPLSFSETTKRMDAAVKKSSKSFAAVIASISDSRVFVDYSHNSMADENKGRNSHEAGICVLRRVLLSERRHEGIYGVANSRAMRSAAWTSVCSSRTTCLSRLPYKARLLVFDSTSYDYSQLSLQVMTHKNTVSSLPGPRR